MLPAHSMPAIAIHDWDPVRAAHRFVLDFWDASRIDGLLSNPACTPRKSCWARVVLLPRADAITVRGSLALGREDAIS
jgi:hypothetical protein